VSYTLKFAAKVSFFAGVVALRCARVGGAAENALSVGAEEFGWEYIERSADGGEVTLDGSAVTVPGAPPSNVKAGKNEGAARGECPPEEWEPWRWRPSM
jgi:hypothetical protein